MAIQSLNGKAFEYACLISLASLLEKRTVNINIQINDNEPALITARTDFNSLTEVQQNDMILAAEAGMSEVIRYEPRLYDNSSVLRMFLQTDANGIRGDVRDVVCQKESENWQIGISCKNNHHAVKHSRLSPTIDFGLMWMDNPVSEEYWIETENIWKYLSEIVQNRPGTLWRNIDQNKEEFIYKPLLSAFSKELNKICKDQKNTTKLFEYLLGSYDFYKVIANKSIRSTEVMAFNMYNTLNKSLYIKPERRLRQTQLPNRLYEIAPVIRNNKLSNNTIEVAFNDWAVRFRIHNASSRVEKSLKFDINLQSVPATLQNNIVPWQ